MEKMRVTFFIYFINKGYSILHIKYYQTTVIPNRQFIYNYCFSLDIYLSNHEEHTLMRRFDHNGDGVISLEEFYNTLASISDN
jgi:Ca2+-binding EF-hand superfamily protein